ncbi:MAG: ABC transporter substrate-binding protein [Candidatus Gallimonas sp.]
MRRMKKGAAVAIAAIMAVSAVSLGACGKKGGYVDEETGTVYLTFAGRSDDLEKANFEAVINSFMAENPNYVVTLEWYANESAYMLAMKGKGSNLPDLFMLGNDNFISYCEAGLLADYKEYVDVDGLSSIIYENAAYGYTYNRRTHRYGWDSSDPDCGFYGYPKDQGPYALMYNKDLFEELADIYNQGKSDAEKISLPSAVQPYTYQEFIDVCLALKDVYESEYNKTFFPCAGYDLDSAVYSNNADFFTEGATEQRITENNFIQAIDWYASLYTRGVIAPYGGTYATGETSFLNGNALFYFAGPWKMKNYWESLTFEWDITPSCVGPAEGAVSTGYIGGMGYCISAKSKVKRQAAYLAEYIATNEGAQRTQYYRGQAIPNLISLSDEFSGDLLNLLSAKNGPAHRSVWIDVIDGYGTVKTAADGTTYTDVVTGKYRPEAYTYSMQWRTDFSNYLCGQGAGGKNVLKGETTAEAACNAYATYLQMALDEMQAQF